MANVGPLSDLAKELPKGKGRQYGIPQQGKRSAACDHGKCSQCWMLKCSCECHDRTQKAGAALPVSAPVQSIAGGR